MEKAKRILLTISGALSIAMIFVWLALGIVFISIANNAELMNRMSEEIEEKVVAGFFEIFFGMFGAFFLYFSVMSIFSAIFAFKGRDSDSKSMMILNIVFGALSAMEVSIVGGILGLISISRKNNRKKQIVEE
ncbi:MAG: hypothetical protein J6Y28_01240 [Acholeplasmatales bacterium]|nr:hypothetical protein [Acholeplasmatales bacterium]